MRAPFAIICVMTSVAIARAQRPPEPAIPEDLAGRLEELEDETRKLEQLARDGARAREQVAAMSWLPRYITAFIDVGAFAVGGNGSGIRSDSLHIH